MVCQFSCSSAFKRCFFSPQKAIASWWERTEPPASLEQCHWVPLLKRQHNYSWHSNWWWSFLVRRMDTHYYPISLVPHGVLSCWFFILGQQIEWRMLSSLFVFPGVPHDRVRAMHRAQGERWDQRKDHSVWIEARFISTTFFTCWSLHCTVSIPKEMGHHSTLAYSMCITEQCWTIKSH